MQQILGDASNITLTAQKRLIRPVYGQTQATPYACYLDPSLREASGTIRVPASTDTLPVARSAAAFTYQTSLTPGLVLVKTAGENVTVAGGADEAIKAFGLLAQWVGGTFDNVKSTNEVAAWRGPDSVYDLLAPAWNDTGLAAEIASATPGKPILLYSGADGRLCGVGATVKKSAGSQLAVAEVVERISSAVLRINLLV